MATFQSAEIIAKEASPGEKYDNFSHVKVAEFNWTTTTETTSDSVELVELPIGSQVIGYALVDAGSGFTAVDIGISAGGTELATAADISGNTVSAFVAPVAVGTTGKVYLDPDTGTVTAAKLVNGVIYYI